MARPQLICRLRIATSVFFAVVAVALCVLWVRSYQANEVYSRISKTGRGISIGSNSGSIYFVTMRRQLSPPTSGVPFDTGFLWHAHEWRYSVANASGTRWAPRFKKLTTGISISLPIWLLVSLSIAFGCLPWSSLRFSLRTLLIATTLVAVALGLGMWAAG